MDVLFGRARMEVLSLLYLNPQQSFYVREIIRRAGVAASNVQKELAILSNAGLIERRQAGRQVYYQAQQKNPIFRELQSIISKTFGLANRFQSALKSLREIKFAVIFGSVARGEQISPSDIDLMVVGGAGFEKISARLSALERQLGRAINLVSYSETEFAKKVRDKHPFVTEVLTRPKIWIIGNEDDFEAMVGQ